MEVGEEPMRTAYKTMNDGCNYHLSEANLSDTNLSEACLNGVFIDKRTVKTSDYSTEELISMGVEITDSVSSYKA